MSSEIIKKEFDNRAEYHLNGKLHRLDGPAVEYANGDKLWYVEGERHRTDGPAIEYANGDKYWYVEGKHHRTDGPAIEYANGVKHWYVKGKRHRLDGPAIEDADGDKYWHVEGKCHRLDGPAVERANGTKKWYVEGKRHRTDGPAIEHADGTKEWWVEGKLHRLDGPAIEYVNGNKYWYVEGKRHRTDGPATEHANGTKSWWIEDKLHRTDGPAIEWSNGDKYWYVDGKPYTEEEFNKIKTTYLTKNSLNKIKEKTKHGILVGTVTEGANISYQMILKLLKEQFDVSDELLNNNANKELLTLVSLVIIHFGATLYNDKPGMANLRKVCELAIEGKVKDNTGALINNLIPMLLGVSKAMDQNSMKRIVVHNNDEQINFLDYEIVDEEHEQIYNQVG